MMDEIKDLVIKAQAGDASVYEELYERTKGKAYYLALQLLKNPHDAEDVLQDSYTNAFLKINDAIPERFSGWLDTIVINRAKDILKKKKPDFFSEAKTENGKEYLLDEVKEKRTEFLPQENMDYMEVKRLLQEIIDGLPEEQRICITLFYYKEMSVSSIASYFECSTGTIKSRLNYARKTIKAKVEELEKKGTKLYSIPVLPFLYWMFHTEAEETVCTSTKVLQGIQTASSKTVGDVISASTNSVGKSVASHGVKALAAKAVGVKVGITAVVVTVGITGGIAMYKSSNTKIESEKNLVVTQTKNKAKSDIKSREEKNTKEKSKEEINAEAKLVYAKKIPSIFKKDYIDELNDWDRYFAIDDINGDGIVECIVFLDEMKYYSHKNEFKGVPDAMAMYIMTYYNGAVSEVLDSSQRSENYIIDKEKGYIECGVSMRGLEGNTYYTIDGGKLKLIKSFLYDDESDKPFSVDDKPVSEKEYDAEIANYYRDSSKMEEMTFYKITEKSVNNILKY